MALWYSDYLLKRHSRKPELRFYPGSNPAHGMSEIYDGEDI